MTTPEVKAAAERWKTRNYILPTASTDPDWLLAPMVADLRTLADYALSLLDETPIDEAWLLSVGFAEKHVERGGHYMKPFVQKQFVIGEWPLVLVQCRERWWAGLGGQEFPDPGVELPDMPTRGAVRLLLSALDTPTRSER